MEEVKKNKSKWLYWFLFATAVIIVYKLFDSFGAVQGFFSKLMGVLTPLFAGILIAYLFYIPARSIEGKIRKSKSAYIRKKARSLSILTVYIIALIAIIIFVNIIIPVVFESVVDLVNNLQGYYNTAIEKINGMPDDSPIKTDVLEKGIDALKNIDFTKYINAEDVSGYIKGIANVASAIFNIFVTVVVSIYILAERREILDFLKKCAAAIFNKKTFNNLNKYFNSANQIFFNFLAGQILDAIVVGILTTIAMSIMGIKYAPLLGFMIGVFNMIPYFGAIIGVALGALITLISGGVSQAIWMLVVVIILQQIDANIINPKIVGNSLKISPLLVIIAVTIGGAYFGVLGMFLAVPVAAALRIIIIDYVNYKLDVKKQKGEVPQNVQNIEVEELDKKI